MNKKDPAMLQRGGLSGGATSADSKKIYPIDISNTTSDSSMYVKKCCFNECHSCSCILFPVFVLYQLKSSESFKPDC